MDEISDEDQYLTSLLDEDRFLISRLLRKCDSELNAFLTSTDLEVKIAETKSVAHCYFFHLGGNKLPRVEDFARFIAHKITDFAIPRSEIAKAISKLNQSGSTYHLNELLGKARALFSKAPTSGEGGEVLLSVLAESFLHFPQVATKMVLKTNSQVHAHGSDGIHFSTNEDNGNLVVYWGESKLYSDGASAARECFKSIAPFLLDNGGSDSRQNRDLVILRDGIDLENEKLNCALKRYLDPVNPLFCKLEYRGICLVGFDCEHYPIEAHKKDIESLSAEIKEVFKARIEHFSSRIKEEKISAFNLHVFCLPFPKVDNFRSAFRKELGLSNG